MALPRQSFLTATGMTPTMRRRWKSQHINAAESYDEALGDNRPVGKVFVTRGYMTRHFEPHRTGRSWRGDWDEKYTWGGQPGQVTSRDPDPAGNPRDIEFRDPVELPYVAGIQISNNMDQNGISTASITFKNVYESEDTGIMGFLYHIMNEGFFSPFYNGDENGFDQTDRDFFLGQAGPAGWVRNDDGKVITGLLMPNRKIEIFQGYGDEIQRTFVGLIDTVEVDIKNISMTITATDFGRMLTETTYTQNSVPPKRFPVAFCDWEYVKSVPRTSWPTKSIDGKIIGAPVTTTPVIDITHIAGRILGWAGFQQWNRTLAGRIGAQNTGSKGGTSRHDAIFRGENFDKGAYFIDGINQIKTLLGYMFYMTPEIDQDVPNGPRYLNTGTYDDSTSRDTIGVPHFEPPNIWDKRPDNEVEQFLDSEILLDGGLIYDHSVIRKQIYVTGTQHKTRKGGRKTFGYSAPFELDYGILSPIYYNVEQELGNIRLTQQEIQVFMRMVILSTMLSFNRGSFTVAGWPGATLNKQVDILEGTAGVWRRFYVTGFSSEMSLGPNASWTTSVEVINMDNVYIRRLKNQIKHMLGAKGDGKYWMSISRPPELRPTPYYVNVNGS